MKGVVFQTSAMTIAKRDAHLSPVHRMWVWNRLLAMPVNAKMNSHSLAVTAVGIDQGTSTLARSSPRPLNARFMMVANHMPRRTSITTVAAVKNTVTHRAGQNNAPSERGGHLTVPPPVLLHCWSSQCVEFLNPAKPPLTNR